MLPRYIYIYIYIYIYMCVCVCVCTYSHTSQHILRWVITEKLNKTKLKCSVK